MLTRVGFATSILVLMFAVAIAIPSAAFAQGSGEVTKIVQLMKAQIELSNGQHSNYHGLIDGLVKRYPNDADLKRMHAQIHDAMHQRMEMEKEIMNSEFFNVTGG